MKNNNNNFDSYKTQLNWVSRRGKRTERRIGSSVQKISKIFVFCFTFGVLHKIKRANTELFQGTIKILKER